jgi:hypothetical protein
MSCSATARGSSIDPPVDWYISAIAGTGCIWKKVEKSVRKEHEQQGFNGRFGPGLRGSVTARDSF